MFNFFKKKQKPDTRDVVSFFTPGIFDGLKSDDIAIDCGANVGMVTMKLAESGAKVYAFEPNVHAFKELVKNTEKFKDIECINKGVLDKNSKLKLYMHKSSSEDEVKWSTGSSFLEYKNNVSKDKFEEIEVVDLAEFIRNLKSPVKILKIDVEGVECEVVNHLIDTGVVKLVEKIFVETHDHRIPELKEKTDTLRERIKKENLNNINLNWI